MKNILCLLTLLVAACSTTTPTDTTDNTARKTTPIYSRDTYTSNVARPTYNDNCNTCSTSYTVSTPVEVIYKDTTYTTVYEPKTYISTSYSRKPYDACTKAELCE